MKNQKGVITTAGMVAMFIGMFFSMAFVGHVKKVCDCDAKEPVAIEQVVQESSDG